MEESSFISSDSPTGVNTGSPNVPIRVKAEGFTTLYDGEGDVVADVVFVHGLQGHPKKTWTKTLPRLPDDSRARKFIKISTSKKKEVLGSGEISERDIFWPKDLLPQKIKNIRILSYGYDSKLAKLIGGVNQNGIHQYAENLLAALERVRSDSGKDVKIIFVTHSLGGIIIKEVLRQSSRHTHQPHLLSIFKATYGIIFFGCPHQGSDAIGWGLVAANFAKLLNMSPNINLLSSLGMDSPTLRTISSDFSVFLKDDAFKVHSFREEKGMTGIAGIIGKVVEDMSSIIGDAGEGKEGINANHQDMCRFESTEDEGFIKAVGVISRYIKDIEVRREFQKGAAQKIPKNDHKQDIASLSEKEKECLQSFVFADYSTYRHQIPKRHPGTLEWLFEHEAYRNWVSETTFSNFLWVSGNPGCGKTVISASILDCLDEIAKARGFKVAYFHCDDKEDRQKSAQSLLRGIIHQLITTTPCLIKHAMAYFDAQGAQIVGSLDTLWRIFHSIATNPLSRNTYIVLDALDECEKTSRDDLLRRLSDYFRLADNNTPSTYPKVLITSRPYREIELTLRGQPVIRLKAEDEELKINHDISSFISHKLDELTESCDYNLEMKKRVQMKLQSGADGMFLWVSLVVEELFETPTSEVFETLESIPSSLNGLYTHLLKRLNGRKAKMAKKILMWVAMAPRPMRVKELAIACSVNDSHTSTSSIGKYLLKGFINDIALCGPILKKEKEDDDEVVHLVHQSAKEFLLSPDLCDSLPDFTIHPERANRELAITCLTYLSFDDFDHGPIDLEKWNYPYEKSISKISPFLYFAAMYWPMFVRHADESHEMIWQAFCRLGQSQKKLKLAFQIFDVHRSWMDEYNTEIYGLVDSMFISVRLGFPSFVKNLLREGGDANGQSGRFSNLYMAASIGHTAVIEQLLEWGADANARGGRYGTALQAAANHGYLPVVQLLLENGADVNARGGHYGNALQAAAEDGHLPVVRLLLEKGADVNAQGELYRNALQAAANRGHLPVVQLLLENGADVNARSELYGNALQAAAEDGHLPVVQLLLENGADVNAQGGRYGNALQAAAEDGHLPVVQLLLENGADVNAQGGRYGNALQAAAEDGHLPVVQLLLENGADVNARGGRYGNALQAAAGGGHLSVVQLLLENGADVNAQCGHYGNALQAAAGGGHLPVVQLLLENGADVNAQGGHYGNALQAAAGGGHLPVVQLLLENGADVNARSELYGNALQAAAGGDHLPVVRLLLEKGADVNAQGGLYGNALQAAAGGGHLPVIQLLLEKGADVNARGGRYGNALQAAAEDGHLPVVQLLLDNGADINASEAALQAANSSAPTTLVLRKFHLH